MQIHTHSRTLAGKQNLFATNYLAAVVFIKSNAALRGIQGQNCSVRTWVNMKNHQKSGEYSRGMVTCTTGPGDDQEKGKLERTGHMCWLFARGYAAARARREMCLHSKPLRRPPCFPQQMQKTSLAECNESTKALFLFIFLRGRVPCWQRQKVCTCDAAECMKSAPQQIPRVALSFFELNKQTHSETSAASRCW